MDPVLQGHATDPPVIKEAWQQGMPVVDMAPLAEGAAHALIAPTSWRVTAGAIQPMMIKLYVRLINSDANDSWRLRLKHPWMPHKHAV